MVFWPRYRPRPCSAFVLEQAVAPGGTLALSVGAVGGGSGGAAPDGGAAGGVGDVHPVAEQLGHQTGVAGLGAAGAGAGELQVGLLELAALDGVVLHVGLGSGLHQVIPDLGLLGLGLLGHHLDGLVLGQAGLHAHAAAHAVQGADADGEVVHALALAGLDGSGLQALGGVGDLLIGQSVGPDGGVGQT